MKEQQQYLDEIHSKIKARLDELSGNIEAGAKEVEAMHDYYWENYTEMDEYGYENYDNSQALLNQINANQEMLLLRSRYQKMLSSPYFGRVDFLYEGDETPESFYIGIGNFSEKKGTAPLIYDWRAPVSGLFYDYDSGPAEYSAPAGTFEGEITSKWQYKIRRGRMIYAVESDIKIDDDVLRQELGSAGETKLKNIIRTIQKEQNGIIRNTKDRIMVIQGVAGSGKTSVALHRIAYLLYHDREHLKASNILILSPNSVFSDYISHILPELGEENIRETGFDTFAYHELKQWIRDCENRCDWLEHLMAGETAPATFHSRQDKAFTGELYGYALMLESELVDFHDIRIRKWVFPADRIQEMFYGHFTDIPLIARMNAVQEYVIDEYETLSGRTLADEELEQVKEQFSAMFLTTDLYKIYNMFLADQGLEPLPDVEQQKRYVPYADVCPMLYLKYLLWGKGSHKSVKHLIIDEMQDYTYLQYRIIRLLFDCPMTILGDAAQTMDETISDVTRFLPKIFGKDIRMLEMNKSYRNTMEIASYAKTSEKYKAVELFDRHGDAVEELTVSKRVEIWDRIAASAGPDTAETTAVITFTMAEAMEAYRELKQLLGTAGYDTEHQLSLIDQDSNRFCPGISVTTFYLAKGLEFEQVHLIDDQSRRGAFYDQARYIGATRAMHGLHVYKVNS